MEDHLHIPQDMLQLYLDYQFSLAKIGQIFGVSSKTIQRRIKIGSFLLFSSYFQNDRKYPRRFEYKIVHTDFIIWIFVIDAIN